MFKKLLLTVGILVIILAASAGVVMWRGLNELRNMDVANVDFGLVDDGEYVGSFGTGLVSATVRVKVKNGQVTGIEILEHNNGRGQPAERIVDSIISNQTLAVDVVAGATASSKVIMKAVEAALR